jgi:hypothetical protein
MPLLRFGFALAFIALSPPAFCQSLATKIAGVSEPPELTGEPPKVQQLSDADKRFFEVTKNMKDTDEIKSTLPKLDAFIAQHPDYSAAYFLTGSTISSIYVVDRHNMISVSARTNDDPGRVALFLGSLTILH